MSPVIAFTLDLEDHDPNSGGSPTLRRRHFGVAGRSRRVGVTGTVFVVGDLLAEEPGLIRLIDERGHEVGLHGADHRALPEVGPDRFRDATKKATEALASTTGKPVLGFRAPGFSLISASAWAPEILTELGYVYSSSVLPARHPIFGWPKAPMRPFRWPCGLIELPVPVVRIGPVGLPMLSSVYLRVIPNFLIKLFFHSLRDYPSNWLYSHPHDYDFDKFRYPMPFLGPVANRVVWWGRHRMRHRVKELTTGSDLTMAAIAARHADAAVFRPPSVAESV